MLPWSGPRTTRPLQLLRRSRRHHDHLRFLQHRRHRPGKPLRHPPRNRWRSNPRQLPSCLLRYPHLIPPFHSSQPHRFPLKNWPEPRQSSPRHRQRSLRRNHFRRCRSSPHPLRLPRHIPNRCRCRRLRLPMSSRSRFMKRLLHNLMLQPKLRRLSRTSRRLRLRLLMRHRRPNLQRQFTLRHQPRSPRSALMRRQRPQLPARRKQFQHQRRRRHSRRPFNPKSRSRMTAGSQR